MQIHRIHQVLRQTVMPAALACLLVGLPMSAQAITDIPHITIPANHSISDPIESVKFTGHISVDGKVIDDPVFNSPMVVELVIDFSNVKIHGDKSTRDFITQAQAILHRPLKAADIIEVTFPYYLESDPSVSRTAVASFETSFAGANKVDMKLKFKPKPSSF
jgi:hypothetical protein